MMLAIDLPIKISLEVNLFNAGIFLFATVFFIVALIRMKRDVTMQTISEKIQVPGLYHCEKGKDEDERNKLLLDEINKLKLENELLKKGNWFNAYIIGIAANRLLKLYKHINKNPVNIHLTLPDNKQI